MQLLRMEVAIAFTIHTKRMKAMRLQIRDVSVRIPRIELEIMILSYSYLISDPCKMNKPCNNLICLSLSANKTKCIALEAKKVKKSSCNVNGVQIDHGKKFKMEDSIQRQCDNGTMKPTACKNISLEFFRLTRSFWF